MGKVLNSLQLQTFLILWIIYIADGAPYSKYGRTCKDIGCLPREVCIMAYDSCSFNQQEGTNCGRFPTCQRRVDSQPPQQNSDPSNTPAPRPNTNIWNLPTTTTTRYTTTTTTTRPTTTTTTTRRQWTTKSPFYTPNNPSYGGGGNFFGSRYGENDPFNAFSRTTSTRRPSSSSSGSSDSFGGFLSGLSSFLSGDVGKLISGALSNRGGGSSSSSGGGFFDTRPLIENKGYRGGLFSENTNRQTQQGAQSTNNNNNYPGGYPVTRENAPSAPSANPSASHGNFGWKLS